MNLTREKKLLKRIMAEQPENKEAIQRMRARVAAFAIHDMKKGKK